MSKFWGVDFDWEIHKEIYEKFVRSHGDDSVIDFTYYPPTGVLIYCEGIPVCAGFMVKTDAGFVLNTNIIASATCDKDTRQTGIIYLRDLLAEKARAAGFNFVLAETNIEGLKKRLVDQGYKILKENMTYLGRSL